MTTKANIIIKDNYRKLYFFRRYDGYPNAVIPSLETFVGWVRDNRIRSNVIQASGWLIILGADEYKRAQVAGSPGSYDGYVNKIPSEPVNEWKVGAYEPTVGIHKDISYLYVIDLDTCKIEIVKESKWKDWID